MAVIPPPPSPIRSPLWGLSFRVEVLQSRFLNLYYDIIDIWLLGIWLAWPFYWIAYALNEAVGLMRNADVWIVSNRGWLEALYDGTMFVAILDDISTTLRWIRIDPLGWLVHHLKLASNDLREIITNASGWFRNKLTQVFPVLNDIQLNPVSWIRYLIPSAFGAVASFMFNPRSILREWLRDLSPIFAGIMYGGFSYILSLFTSRYYWFGTFLANPLGYIRTWILRLNPDLSGLLDNSRTWLVTKIAGILGISEWETLNLPSRLGIVVLKKINDNIITYRENVTSLLCSIVLKFI